MQASVAPIHVIEATRAAYRTLFHSVLLHRYGILKNGSRSAKPFPGCDRTRRRTLRAWRPRPCRDAFPSAAIALEDARSKRARSARSDYGESSPAAHAQHRPSKSRNALCPGRNQAFSSRANRSHTNRAPRAARRRFGGTPRKEARALPRASKNATSIGARMPNVWMLPHGTSTTIAFHD